MFPFTKFHSITNKIYTLIVKELKNNSPKKYWSFWFSDLIAKIGMYGAFFLIGTYIILEFIMQFNSMEVPEQLVKGFVNPIILLLLVGVIAGFVRAKFYSELEAMVLDIWQVYVNGKY